MNLTEALLQASEAVPYGLDMSYDADQDALRVLAKAYLELLEKYEKGE